MRFLIVEVFEQRYPVIGESVDHSGAFRQGRGGLTSYIEMNGH